MSFINGQGRKVLVNTTVVASNGSLPTSINFGSFKVPEFAGILGMIKADSNFAASVQLDYRVENAVSIVTSAIAVTSGIVVNELNPGLDVNISLIGVSSNSPFRVYLTGLPIR